MLSLILWQAAYDSLRVSWDPHYCDHAADQTTGGCCHWHQVEDMHTHMHTIVINLVNVEQSSSYVFMMMSLYFSQYENDFLLDMTQNATTYLNPRVPVVFQVVWSGGLNRKRWRGYGWSFGNSFPRTTWTCWTRRHNAEWCRLQTAPRTGPVPYIQGWCITDGRNASSFLLFAQVVLVVSELCLTWWWSLTFTVMWSLHL